MVEGPYCNCAIVHEFNNLANENMQLKTYRRGHKRWGLVSETWTKVFYTIEQNKPVSI